MTRLVFYLELWSLCVLVWALAPEFMLGPGFWFVFVRHISLAHLNFESQNLRKAYIWPLLEGALGTFSPDWSRGVSLCSDIVIVFSDFFFTFWRELVSLFSWSSTSYWRWSWPPCKPFSNFHRSPVNRVGLTVAREDKSGFLAGWEVRGLCPYYLSKWSCRKSTRCITACTVCFSKEHIFVKSKI